MAVSDTIARMTPFLTLIGVAGAVFLWQADQQVWAVVVGVLFIGGLGWRLLFGTVGVGIGVASGRMKRDSARLDELLHEWQVTLGLRGQPSRMLANQFLDQELPAPKFLAQHYRPLKREDVPQEPFSVRAMVYDGDNEAVSARLFCEVDGTFAVAPTVHAGADDWQGDRTIRMWQRWSEVVSPGGEREAGAMIWLGSCGVFAYGLPEVQDQLAPWLAVHHGDRYMGP
jgi:hypothetical protein